MKKYLLLTFLLISYLHAQILETAHFADLEKYVTPHSLVVLDIDDTLLIPVQTLGSDAWFLYQVKEHEKKMAPKEAFEKALADWQAVRHMTEMRIVEPGSEKVVESLQQKGIRVMGLTTQGLALATRTLHHIRLVGVNLSLTAPFQKDDYFINGTQGVLYRQGLLFTAGTPKGQALLTFLAHCEYAPKHIIFLNDKEKHLKDVEEVCLAKNIEFTGLRYSFCDERNQKFDPVLADLQWRHSTFSHLLSDEEAAKLK